MVWNALILSGCLLGQLPPYGSSPENLPPTSGPRPELTRVPRDSARPAAGTERPSLSAGDSAGTPPAGNPSPAKTMVTDVLKRAKQASWWDSR